VVDRLLHNACSHVGDQRETKNFEPHVASHNDLVHRAHANEVGAKGAECADFGRCFVAGAEDGKVNAFRQRNVLRGSLNACDFAQAIGVGRGHVKESLTCGGRDGKFWLVGAERSVGAGEVDVVGDAD